MKIYQNSNYENIDELRAKQDYEQLKCLVVEFDELTNYLTNEMRIEESENFCYFASREKIVDFVNNYLKVSVTNSVTRII